MLTLETLQPVIFANVTAAIEEDIASGDITAELIPADEMGRARIITREAAVIAGTAWVDEVFRQVDPEVEVNWEVKDGDRVIPDQALFTLKGKSRSLLTGERAALNFLQTLSGTATVSAEYADRVANTPVRLLDTRKTIPGLRMAQKYAVACGGCYNHRIGLFDAFLIKENHIQACGGIAAAVNTARAQAPGKPVEVEVETMDELRQALEAACDRVMLDNFSLPQMREAVALTAGRLELE